MAFLLIELKNIWLVLSIYDSQSTTRSVVLINKPFFDKSYDICSYAFVGIFGSNS